MKTYCIKVGNDLNYGFVVKWLRHHSFKVGLMGSSPAGVIIAQLRRCAVSRLFCRREIK